MPPGQTVQWRLQPCAFFKNGVEAWQKKRVRFLARPSANHLAKSKGHGNRSQKFWNKNGHYMIFFPPCRARHDSSDGHSTA